jgi:hypothetical protein
MRFEFGQRIIDIIRGKTEVNWENEKLYEQNVKRTFKNHFGYDLDLNNPKTFSEKMQWLRIYDNTPLKTRLADKYLVREWVKEKIGAEYLMPLLGVYENFNEIDFDKLPNRFFIQCNHGCGYNITVKDKSALNIQEAGGKINRWMSENFAYQYGELHYKDIKRKIVVSKYLENMDDDIYDYKYFCFNGKPKYILYVRDRKSGILRNAFYDLDWNKQEFIYAVANKIERYEQNIDPPKNFEKMTEIAKILAKEFIHVRIDFYNIDGKIYFGEMTFTTAVGHLHFKPKEWDLKLGEMMKLPGRKVFVSRTDRPDTE